MEIIVLFFTFSHNVRGLYEVADERDGIILNHQSEEGNLGELLSACVSRTKKERTGQAAVV